MFRMMLLALTVFGFILLLYIAYLAYRKVRNGISTAWDKSVEVANDQQERWKRREQFKTLPEFLQKAHRQSEQVEEDTEQLPVEWRTLLDPLNQAMQHILSTTTNDTKRADSVRSFYNTSLPAYASFVAKLRTDHSQLAEDEIEKAKANIAVFKEDFARYDEGIQSARRFDFDVLMDVIKTRLNNR